MKTQFIRLLLTLALGVLFPLSGRTEPNDLTLELGGGVSLRLIRISAGTFEMGSSTAKLLDQKPAHMVTIPGPFYLGEFEVTQEQWAAVTGSTPSINKGPKFPDCAKYPVENVSWNHCHTFLAALDKKFPDYTFRLPTEAEWEYACRAGTKTEFGFGDHATGCADHAWFSDNAGGQTRPVGQKKPNAWGLYDMQGNVWEWCDDLYKAYPDGVLPPGVFVGASRVLRGGAFNSQPVRLSCAYRHNLEPEDCGRYYGFRCAAVRKSLP